jgi:membrane protein involved in colicin uptake
MTYTNIASPYTTAGDPNANFNFNRHSWTLFNQANPSMSKSQFKVALQQLEKEGALDSSRGYANEKLRTEILQGAPGMYSDQNPLGQYQGQYGNFGLKSYEAAKGADWKPQDIFDEIQSGRSGMMMGDRAMTQYYNDLKVERDAAQAEKDTERYDAQVKRDAERELNRQQDARDDRALRTRLANEEAAARKAAADATQSDMLASMRIGGSSTLGASGAATFKGKGLKTSGKKRGSGRGTGQLRRPYERSALSITSMAKGNNPSTLNL